MATKTRAATAVAPAPAVAASGRAQRGCWARLPPTPVAVRPAVDRRQRRWGLGASTLPPPRPDVARETGGTPCGWDCGVVAAHIVASGGGASRGCCSRDTCRERANPARLPSAVTADTAHPTMGGRARLHGLCRDQVAVPTCTATCLPSRCTGSRRPRTRGRRSTPPRPCHVAAAAAAGCRAAAPRWTTPRRLGQPPPLSLLRRAAAHALRARWRQRRRLYERRSLCAGWAAAVGRAGVGAGGGNGGPPPQTGPPPVPPPLQRRPLRCQHWCRRPPRWRGARLLAGRPRRRRRRRRWGRLVGTRVLQVLSVCARLHPPPASVGRTGAHLERGRCPAVQACGSLAPWTAQPY